MNLRFKIKILCFGLHQRYKIKVEQGLTNAKKFRVEETVNPNDRKENMKNCLSCRSRTNGIPRGWTFHRSSRFSRSIVREKEIELRSERKGHRGEMGKRVYCRVIISICISRAIKIISINEREIAFHSYEKVKIYNI